MQLFALRPHVRACIDGANLVFLDLRHDRYRAVPIRSAPTIVGFTDEGPRRSASAASLVALDLIEEVEGAVDCAQRRTRAPEAKLAIGREAQPTLMDAVRFVVGCNRAAFALKRRRLDLTLASIVRRKVLLREGAQPVERAVGVFEALRPWYPRARVCLFDSLALMSFMLDCGIAPTLVLGVRTTPFAAHCWLELGDRLVSDMSDYCPSFTPIAWV
jgi:hypothetical protein